MKTKKQNKTFSYLVFALLLVAIPVGIYVVGQNQETKQQAAPATVLTFSPQTVVKRPGETFALDVMVDTGSNTISAAKFQIDFDTTKLEAKSIVASDFLTVILTSGKVTPSNASITLGSSPTAPKKGAGKLATITFKAKGPIGATRITFDNATEVAGISEQTNVLSGKGSATVTITTGVGSQISSPTTTPTPARIPGANQPTVKPLPPYSQPAGKVSFGTIGTSTPAVNVQTPNIPIPELTPIPQPAETIKDPLVISYLKLVIAFIKSLF